MSKRYTVRSPDGIHAYKECKRTHFTRQTVHTHTESQHYIIDSPETTAQRQRKLHHQQYFPCQTVTQAARNNLQTSYY